MDYRVKYEEMWQKYVGKLGELRKMDYNSPAWRTARKSIMRQSQRLRKAAKTMSDPAQAVYVKSIAVRIEKSIKVDFKTPAQYAKDLVKKYPEKMIKEMVKDGRLPEFLKTTKKGNTVIDLAKSREALDMVEGAVKSIFEDSESLRRKAAQDTRAGVRARETLDMMSELSRIRKDHGDDAFMRALYEYSGGKKSKLANISSRSGKANLLKFMKGRAW